MNSILLTQPNLHPGIQLFERHELPLPQCCPVSGNPQPGSKILISYHPEDKFLEVYSLKKYIDIYVGGYDAVRDMEGMILQIAQDCATVLGVFVRVDAHILLQKDGEMHLYAKARPKLIEHHYPSATGQAVCPHVRSS